MKPTTILREKLGLSQEDMAQYLLVSRSLLAKYETGQRYLPTAAMVKLAELELFLQRPAVKTAEERPHVKLHRAKAKKILERHSKEQHYQLAVAQRKLENVQKVYAQKMLLLDAVDHLKATRKNSENDDIEILCLDLMQLNALHSIDQYGLHKQAMLQLQVDNANHQYEQAIRLQQSVETGEVIEG